VTAPPAPAAVATVTASLASPSIQTGQTTQATAVTRDANNNVLTGRVVTWSSSNTGIATVSSSGLVTAVAAGSATITATSETKTGSATLTVTTPPSPPPPDSTSHEPSGMTTVIDRRFDAVNEGGMTAYSPSNAASLSIVQDATAPKSPANVFQFRYEAGYSSSGHAPGTLEKGLPNPRTIYISYWIKLSSNWQGHEAGVLKNVHLWAPVVRNVVIPMIYGAGSSPLVAAIAIQNGVSSDGLRKGNVSSGTFSRGVWHRFEIVIVGNTAGTADGSMEWWLDGAKVGSFAGLQFTSEATNWSVVQFGPTWGGAGGPSVPADQYVWLDHMYVSGKP